MEYQYLDNQISSLVKICDSETIQYSETLLDQLINHFEQRIKVVKKLKQINRRKSRFKSIKSSDEKNKQKIINTTLTETQRAEMKCLFDYLLNCLKNEGFIDSHDDIVQNVSKSAKHAVNGANWEKTLEHLNKSMKYLRPFNVNKLVCNYNQFRQLTSDKLNDEKLIIFIGRTGL